MKKVKLTVCYEMDEKQIKRFMENYMGYNEGEYGQPHLVKEIKALPQTTIGNYFEINEMESTLKIE